MEITLLPSGFLEGFPRIPALSSFRCRGMVWSLEGDANGKAEEAADGY
jgi:hypothetical protein